MPSSRRRCDLKVQRPSVDREFLEPVILFRRMSPSVYRFLSRRFGSRLRHPCMIVRTPVKDSTEAVDE